jgi:hypothetical protein
VRPVCAVGGDDRSIKRRSSENDMNEHDRRHLSGSATSANVDPGAFVGNRPERQAETIPGGIGPKDERIAAHSTQPGTPSADETPTGHREADVSDRQEAGQDR